MERQPIEVFDGYIKKAELMIPLCEALETGKDAGEELSADVNGYLDELKEDHPFIALAGVIAKTAVEAKFSEHKDDYNLFRKTIRELTIIPAITATEAYYKNMYYLQKGNEFNRTIGSLDTIKDNIENIDPEAILDDEEIKLAKKGFSF